MLSSLSCYVRMLDGRDRGQVIEVNREIALDLIERKQALAIDVTEKAGLEPWSEAQLAEFRRQQDTAEHEIQFPIAELTEVKVQSEAGEVAIPQAAAEVSTPRGKNKKR